MSSFDRDRQRGAESRVQYESDETTSPPPMVPRARLVRTLIELFTRWTLPLAKSELTPPG
jgi:hypothetical protein